MSQCSLMFDYQPHLQCKKDLLDEVYCLNVPATLQTNDLGLMSCLCFEDMIRFQDDLSLRMYNQQEAGNKVAKRIGFIFKDTSLQLKIKHEQIN